MADYDKLTVLKLRDELVKRGLPKTGLKAVLIQRLEEADAQTGGAISHLDGAAIPTQLDGSQEQSITIGTKPAPANDEAGKEDAGRSDDAPGNPQPDERPVSEMENGDGGFSGDKGLRGNESTNIDTTHNEVPPVESVAQPTKQESKSETPSKASNLEQGIQSERSPGDAMESVQEPRPTPQLPTSSQTQSEQNIITSAAGPEDLLEDSRKRKRRSQSPPPSSVETLKRLKADKNGPHVELPEDVTIQEKTPHIKDEQVASSHHTNTQNDGLQINGRASSIDRSITPKRDSLVGNIEPSATGQEDTLLAQSQSAESTIKASPSDTRFKNLFTSPSKADSSSKQLPYANTEDRAISPAIHSATSALYIRELMRPLKPESIRDHLIALATPPDSPVNSTIVTKFFLDPIRTHCLVGFENISAASRVRSGLHDRIWPNERDRRSLYVDFIPEEKLKKWIDVEQNAPSGRGHPQKRWEVIYEDEGGEIKAYLQEVGTNGGLRATQPAKADIGQGVVGAPSGPRLRESEPRAAQPRPDNGKGFQALDDLFKSTMAKPKLYYQPVTGPIAEQRLAKLAAGRGGGRSDEMRRYTFEDDILVDKAPEYGNRGGGRGGYGGRGGFSGGYRGRGAGYRGDGYRGGGDSWRDRRPGY